MFVLELDGELGIALRERHHAADFAALIDANRAHLSEWFHWARHADESTVRGWAADGLEQFRRGDGWHGTLLERGQPVGAVGLHYLDRRRGVTEVGYWLAEAAEGRGVMTRALEGLLRHFFDGLRLEKVVIGVPPDNRRSAALPERLGFTPEARVRRVHRLPDGSLGDLEFHGLLRGEWAAGVGDAARSAPVPLPRFALDASDDLRVGLFEAPDAEPLSDLVRSEVEHLRPWMPWADSASPEEQRQFIEQRALGHLATGAGFDAGLWLHGELVGSIGLFNVDEARSRGEVGYWIARHAQGRGLVTRAVRRVLQRCFGELGFERVEIRCDVANHRSRAVPERLGFRHEGTLRRGLWNGREATDLALYGLLREEWERAGGSST